MDILPAYSDKFQRLLTLIQKTTQFLVMLDVIHVDVDSCGRLMYQAGKNWQLTVEDRVQFREISCEISSEGNDTRVDFVVVSLSNDHPTIPS
jgi:hypothetical protein